MTGRIRIIAAVLCGAALLGAAAWAGPPEPPGASGAAVAPASGAAAPAERLARLVRVGPLLQVVATEGARHGLSLERSLFPGRGGRGWAAEVARIQSPERLAPLLIDAFAAGLGEEALAQATAFFGSDLGRRITAREVETRRAMLDAAVEEGALSAAARLRRAETGRAALIDRLIDALDLVAANVSGGMNANFAFYRGLGDGGALARAMSEREMLDMVREQEGQIRANTSRWLRAYLTAAYAPLSDEDIKGYIAFAVTPAGQRYVVAMSRAYEAVFERTSYDLGLAAARYMASEDA